MASSLARAAVAGGGAAAAAACGNRQEAEQGRGGGQGTCCCRGWNVTRSQRSAAITEVGKFGLWTVDVGVESGWQRFMTGAAARIPLSQSQGRVLHRRGSVWLMRGLYGALWADSSESPANAQLTSQNEISVKFTGEPTTPCDSCNGRGWLLCDFCKGQKINVQAKNNRIYRRCPSCRTAGVVICPRCKVFKCVSFPDENDAGMKR